MIHEGKLTGRQSMQQSTDGETEAINTHNAIREMGNTRYTTETNQRLPEKGSKSKYNVHEITAYQNETGKPQHGNT